ncbi:M24 family metallopeptidase [Bacillus xiapuensis]|uniref:M24 family metallopeptidase n=1 Tax=Bacillus xiapuensis TaxID=2014075 RepID=UPI000C24EA44|nr:Xaa-Pro peptidase family protein [Bacillus xiapuensis]
MRKLEKLREQLKEDRLDGILVMSPYNRRYLTGFTGTAGAAVVTAEAAVFITDFRYTEQAQNQARDFNIVQQKGTLLEEIARQTADLSIRRLGFEKAYVTFQSYEVLQNLIQAEMVPVSGLIENLRLIKNSSEIKILKEAAEIADAAFKHILEFIQPGMTELEVSNELEFFMRKCGATSSSFDTIVASGKRSALPHGVASDKVIEKGDMVTLDYGAYYKGYVSDITRTIAVGNPPDQLKEVYQVVLDAQLKGMSEIKAGMTGKEADAITRNYITEHGYGDCFGHSTGHGIGLEIHEEPSLSVRSSKVLQPGMAITVEPGIYLPGVGGVRIEDDTLITETGNEPLTHSAKDLIIL